MIRREGTLSGLLKFKEILSHIEKNYVDDVDSDDLVETAINSMLEKLDPHSVYIPASEFELAQAQLEGEFEGIGIEFNIIKDTIYVVAPLSGGPSEQIGLLSGDKIVTVDGENVAGINMTNRGVIDRLRGKKGTEVIVGIKRKNVNEILDFTIVRDKIPQFSVDVSYMVDDEIGYIKVSRFAATTYKEFKEALVGLKESGMKKLILDLQGNPGGYMDRAIDMVDEMLAGNNLIVYTDGRENRFDSEARARRNGIFEEGPVIVLINEGSASASEIVSGALQDNDRALIVGRRSFGKGLVQMPIRISDGSELRLTISRYYTPSGRSIQKPYEDGADNSYSRDLLTRYEHGELFNEDSVQFNDSLRYKTVSGRSVYGGGGIMPDRFVPLDTTMNSVYFNRLFTTNSLREYTFEYYQNNKRQLEQMTLSEYIKDFEVNDKMLKDLAELAVSNNLKFDEEQFERSKKLIKLHTKAHIGRLVWEEEAYYPIVNYSNEIFQEALKLFDEAEKLAVSIK